LRAIPIYSPIYSRICAHHAVQMHGHESEDVFEINPRQRMRLFKKEQQIGFDSGEAFQQQRMSVEE
jgi:hypothetical protein